VARRPVIEQVIHQDVGPTRYTVLHDIMRQEWKVLAHTRIPARTVYVADGLPPVTISTDEGDEEVRIESETIDIPEVDEKFITICPRDITESNGDETNIAAECLAYGMMKLQPRVEENERRRLVGEPSLGQEERSRWEERQNEERERLQRAEEARQAKIRVEEERKRRAQEQLESIEGWGMF